MEQHLNTYYPDLNITVNCETEKYLSVTGISSGRYNLEKILLKMNEWYPYVTSGSWYTNSGHCLVFYYEGGNVVMSLPSGPRLMVNQSGLFSMDNFRTAKDLEFNLLRLKHIFKICSL
jgi:hypothetical protein